MSRRGWVGWIEEHRSLVSGLVMWLLFGSLVMIPILSTGGGETVGAAAGPGRELPPATTPTPGRTSTDLPGTGGPGGAAGATPGQDGGASDASSGGATGGGDSGGSSPTPGTSPNPGSTPPVPGTDPIPPCAQEPSTETGVSFTRITIGQIVTDSSSLPGQFRPAHEGLMAYLRLVNRAGGICGRTIEVEYRNDQGNPSTHDYPSMARRVFAFVANESLLDGFDYQTEPPFDPRYRDEGTGGYVPDVGGLAFAYGRAQSAMHAGVVGSVSPVLVGGGQPRFFLNEAARAGRPCAGAGVVYLVEPTGASEDQAKLGKAALEASWGGNLRARGVPVREYQASLASPVLVYRGIVQNMIRDGVNCAFSYADLASNINLVNALYEEGVWPPGRCNRLDRSECFGVVSVPFTGYDPRFIGGAAGNGEAALEVRTFIPHVPIRETANPAMKAYLDSVAALHADPEFRSAQPSTFSLLGFTSGIMFVDALQDCGGGPTRACLMTRLRALRAFEAGGLLGGTTPFARTRATYGSYGSFDWKWIFNTSVAVRVSCTRPDLACFSRVNPARGFFRDTLHVARGTAG